MTRSLTQQFVDWALALQPNDIPAAVAHDSNRHLLDGWGCVLAASRLGAAEPALAVARMTTAPAQVRVPGTDDVLPVTAAAFALGALVHALDFDDTHPVGLVHATAAVLPALAAVGELVGADAETLLVAACIGYELVCRLGAAVPHGFHARGFHATSVCGVFAATAVAARLLGLSADQTMNALGIAGSTAAGGLEFLDAGADTKTLHPAFAAQAGVTAAHLAQHGATGPATIVEGRHGLFAAYLQQPAPTRLFATLGEEWEVARIDVKPYPCCHLSHASLDALKAAAVPGSDVAGCVIELPKDSVPIVAEPRAGKLAPRSPYDAKFSLPWTAAALLIDGDVTVDTFISFDRPDVRELAAAIEIVGVGHDGPPATAAGRARLRTHGGYEVDTTAAAGRVLDDDMLVAKFVANAGGSAAHAATARDMLENGWRIG